VSTKNGGKISARGGEEEEGGYQGMKKSEGGNGLFLEK